MKTLLEAIERYAAVRVDLAHEGRQYHNGGCAIEGGSQHLVAAQAEYEAASLALGAVLATLSEPLLDSTVAKAARVLSDRDAARWKFVPEPHWKANKEEAIADARAMLEAIQ